MSVPFPLAILLVDFPLNLVPALLCLHVFQVLFQFPDGSIQLFKRFRTLFYFFVILLDAIFGIFVCTGQRHNLIVLFLADADLLVEGLFYGTLPAFSIIYEFGDISSVENILFTVIL